MKPLRGWIVRVGYVFVDRAVSIAYLSELVGGELLPPYGGASHAIGNQPFETTLEWRMASLEDARAALARLESIPTLREPRLGQLRQDRLLEPVEYSIRASAAREGTAICVACASRIPVTTETIVALDGAGPNSDVTLRCENCGLAMDWVILPEGGRDEQ